MFGRSPGKVSKPGHNKQFPKAAKPKEPSHAKEHPKANRAAASAAGEESKKRKATSSFGGEDDFPRGGGSALTPLEYREAKLQADAELFKETPPLKKAKKSFAQSGRRGDHDSDDGGDEDEDNDEDDDDETGESAKRAGLSMANFSVSLSLKDMYVGMDILGTVTMITELGLTVALPNGLTARAAITEISDPLTEEVKKALAEGTEVDPDDEEHKERDIKIPDLTDMFSPGRIVRVQVLALPKPDGKEKKVQVTLNPKKVNKGVSPANLEPGMTLPGFVQSVADHGFVISFGIGELSAFLKTAEAEEYCKSVNKGKPLKVGQLLDCSIMGKAKGRLLPIAVSPEVYAKSVVSTALPIEELRPGMLVNAAFEKRTSNGIAVSFLEALPGTITTQHLEKSLIDKKDLSPQQKIKARILFVDLANKRCALTTLPHLVSWRPFVFSAACTLGTVMKDCKITRVDGKRGLYVQSKGFQCYVKAKNLSDKVEVNLTSPKNAVGTVHTGRVIGFDSLHGVVLLTFKKSIVEHPYFSFSDIHVGQIVQGRIKKIEKFGMLIKLGPRVSALCPPSHYGDTEVTNPTSKFKVGEEISCLVLSLDQSKQRVFLSHKKTLMNSELPRYSSIEQISPGDITHGVITQVNKHLGIFIEFLNRVSGLVSFEDLGDGVVTMEESFHVGQVVKCRVKKVDVAKMRIALTFNLVEKKKKAPAAKGPESLNKGEEIPLGTLVTGTVTGKIPDGLRITIGSASASAFLLKNHLSDHHELCSQIFQSIPEGTTLSGLLVLFRDGGGNLFLSNKASLVSAAKTGSLPVSLSEISVGKVYHGYIRSVTDYGCFVGFLGDAVGLAIRKELSDVPLSRSISETFPPGHSVRAHVLEVSLEDNRMLLSLKQSLCRSHDSSYLGSLFTDSQAISGGQLALLNHSEDSLPKDLLPQRTFKIGDVVSANVKAVEQSGAFFGLKGTTLAAFASPDHFKDVELKAGAEVSAVILDIDEGKGLVDLSLKPALVKSRGRQQAADVKSLVSSLDKKKKELLANVELQKEDYLVVSLHSHNRAIAFVSLKDYNFNEKVKDATYTAKTDLSVSFGSSSHSINADRLLLNLNEAVHPEPPVVFSLEDFPVGALVTCKIVSLKETQMWATVSGNVRARIQISEILEEDAPFNPKDKTANREATPLAKFHVGNEVTGRVFGRWSPKDKGFESLDVTLKPTVVASKEMGQRKSLYDFLKQERCFGYITKFADEGVHVEVAANISGFIANKNLSDNEMVVKNPQETFSKGDRVHCYVLGLSNGFQLSLVPRQPLSKAADKAKGPLTVGQKLKGNIEVVDPAVGLRVKLSTGHVGMVFLTEISDEFENDPTSKFKEEQEVEVTVMKANLEKHQVDLTIRPYPHKKLLPEGEVDPKTPFVINSHSEAKPKMLLKGYVNTVIPKGVVVTFGAEIKTVVPTADAVDDKCSFPTLKKIFPSGKLVHARVLSGSADSLKVALKHSLVRPKSEQKDKKNKDLTLDDLVVNSVVTGTVTSVKELGVFVTIDKCRFPALSHPDQAKEKPNDDLAALFSVGDRVKAKIIKVDKEKKRITLGLKPSFFTKDSKEDQDNTMDVNDDNESDQEGKEKEEKPKETATKPSARPSAMEVDHPAAQKKKEVTGDEELEEEQKKREKAAAETLSISSTFQWDGIVFKNPAEGKGKTGEDSDGSENEDDDDEEGDIVGKAEMSKKKSKKVKVREREEQEKQVSKMEEDLLDPRRTPQSAADYERLLLASPNSSFLWIKFMAFQLGMTEIDKARAVAERALETINFREEAEKMNVWVALLNLENTYGTNDSLLKVFERSLLYNDPKKMHLHLVKIYERTNKTEFAEQIYQSMCKKFKESSKVWTLCGMFKMKQGKHDAARNILQKSLKSLPKRKHIKTISKFAQMEFRLGEPERGRTIFEGIMTTYPKRVDLWSIFLDMELRDVADAEVPRNLFERLIHMKWSSKKMKYFFKRFLEFEKEHGDADTVEHVKQKAREYVESQA